MKKALFTLIGILLLVALLTLSGFAEETNDVIIHGIPEPLYSVNAIALYENVFKDPIGYWNAVDEANQKAILIYPDGSGITHCPAYTNEFIDYAPFYIRQGKYEYNETLDMFLTYPYANNECSIKYTNEENLKLFIYPENMKAFLKEIELDNPEDIRIVRESIFLQGYLLYIVKDNNCYFVPLLNEGPTFEFEDRKKYTLEEFAAKFERIDATFNVFDEEIKCDVPPFIQYGSGVIPLRAALEAMGVEVLWIEESNTIRFECFEVQLNLLYESLEDQTYFNEVGYTDSLKKLNDNGEVAEEYYIGYVVINGRTFVEPESLMNAIGEHYGIKVNVDRDDYSVNVESITDNFNS